MDPSRPAPRARRAGRHRLEQRLAAPWVPVADAPVAVHAPLCRRRRRHRGELFVFVAHPAAPADHTLAARRLRPLVTARTIRGGARSATATATGAATATATKLATATRCGTWRTHGRDPFPACHQLLRSGQL